MTDAIKTIGDRQYQAAEFLIEFLSEGEKLSSEVFQQAAHRGISESTLNHVREIAQVKARRAGGRWYMHLSEGARDYFMDCVRRRGEFWAEPKHRSQELGAISSDWMAVVTHRGEGSDCAALPDGGLHIKIGAVEFTANSAFPTEKLIEVLRELGVTGGC